MELRAWIELHEDEETGRWTALAYQRHEGGESEPVLVSCPYPDDAMSAIAEMLPHYLPAVEE